MSTPVADTDVKSAGSADDVDDSIWLMTFLNLLLVLLALFISVVSHKHFAKEKRAPPKTSAVVKKGVQRAALLLQQRKEKAKKLRDRLDTMLKEQGFANARVDLHQGAPRIILASGVVFKSGSAKLTRQARLRLAAVGRTLGALKNMIVVEGHTDDRPIHTVRYPSNWELSTARALAVVRLFIAGGMPPKRLEFAGYGEFQPQRPNDSEANRRANRRIEIKVR